MEGWIVVASIVTAIAGLTAAGAAIWLAFLNQQLVRASQEQVQASLTEVRVSQEQVAVSQDQVRASRDQTAVSQEQVRIGQEQLSTQERPVLVPAGTPTFQPDHDNWLKWDDQNQPLKLRNLGAGAAFNIAGVLYGCGSYQHDGPLGVMNQKSVEDIHWTRWLGMPIAPGKEESCSFNLGASVFLSGNNHIQDYSFNAPDEEMPGTTPKPDALWRVARVTLTYHDISGRKHASIFDYIHNRGWYKVALLPNIEHDLYDLEGWNREIVEDDPKGMRHGVAGKILRN